MKTHAAILIFSLSCFFLPFESTAQVPLPGETGRKPAIVYDYFPSRMHAFIWRNWTVVPQSRLATVLGATEKEVERVARSMGLPRQQSIQPEWATSRGYITVLRRNWHLLPYDQLMVLLEMSREELAWKLIEDDFLFVKLGNVKPYCERLSYQEPTAEMNERAAEIGTWMKRFGKGAFAGETPRFDFVREFRQVSKRLPVGTGTTGGVNGNPFELRLIFSYFADYGDPLLDPELTSYPEGLLQKLSSVGINGIWLHSVLRMFVPAKDGFPGDEKAALRIDGLKRLVDRAARYGIRIYLYMNEPRGMSRDFFASDPIRKEWGGAMEGEMQAFCVSNPAVRQWLTASVASLFSQVKGLGGAFTITASENLTTCVSHGRQASCERCQNRNYADLIVDVNRAIADGVEQGDPKARVLVWDWGWSDGEAESIIKRLPKTCWLMSVSEWSMPIERGGIKSQVGEYSLSAVGPGPRARRHWAWAKEAGLKTVAKVQVNSSWEMSAVPALPVLDLVGRHADGLSKEQTDGVMLSWSLGGYPSINLDLFQHYRPGHEEAVLDSLAQATYGKRAVPDIRRAWRYCSDAFQEFPYHIQTLYNGPQQVGPSNPLYVRPTGYQATMVGLPYDAVESWRSIYPLPVWIDQFERVSAGFSQGSRAFAEAEKTVGGHLARRVHTEWIRCEVVRIHLASAAQQARFTAARDRWLTARDRSAIGEMRQAAQRELELVVELLPLVKADSTIGYESSNHYFYLPADLLETYISICHALKWLESL